MKLWAVYDSPLDFIGMYVAREFDIPDGLPTEVHFAAIDLSEVRQWIINEAAKEMIVPYRLAAVDGDDPCILETWI